MNNELLGNLLETKHPLSQSCQSMWATSVLARAALRWYELKGNEHGRTAEAGRPTAIATSVTRWHRSSDLNWLMQWNDSETVDFGSNIIPDFTHHHVEKLYYYDFVHGTNKVTSDFMQGSGGEGGQTFEKNTASNQNCYLMSIS